VCVCVCVCVCLCVCAFVCVCVCTWPMPLQKARSLRSTTSIRPGFEPRVLQPRSRPRATESAFEGHTDGTVYWFAQLHSGPLPCLKGHIQLVLHVFGDIPTFIGSYHGLGQLQSWRLTETRAVWWLVAVMRVRFLQPHTRPINHDACSTRMCIGCRGCDIYLPGSTCTAGL
jgi:hypothetical protein